MWEDMNMKSSVTNEMIKTTLNNKVMKMVVAVRNQQNIYYKKVLQHVVMANKGEQLT